MFTGEAAVVVVVVVSAGLKNQGSGT